MKTPVIFVTFPIALAFNIDLLLDPMEKTESDVACVSPDGTPYMVPLLKAIAKRYFKHRSMVILYDDYFYYHSRFKVTLDTLLRTYEYPFRHGRINTTMAKPKVPPGILLPHGNEIMAFIVFTKEPEIGADVVREYTTSTTYVILVAQTSVYYVKSFLRTKAAAEITNLLVLVDPTIKVDRFTQINGKALKKCDILLFSHVIVTDAFSESQPVIISAWRRDRFTRQVPQFPPKFNRGLGGKHLLVAASEIAPFVFRRRGIDSGEGYTITVWDGLEVRLMNLVSAMLNLSLEYKEPKEEKGKDTYTDITIHNTLNHPWVHKHAFHNMANRALSIPMTEESLIKEKSIIESTAAWVWGGAYRFNMKKLSGDAAELVLREVEERRADLAVGGVYLTAERVDKLAFPMPHTHDCASYISLSSTALPKYRAIMGPFLWDVWLALIATYLLAMFPIAFSVWHTIKPLLNDVRELENMFWYVFGTFTNCFTFTGKNSWGKSEKNATKLFIGTYWVFTIIITACYTGSIVAFITLPVYPETVDTSRDLLEENFRISVLENGNWYQLFNDTEDPIAKALNKSVDTVPDIFAGLKNVTKNVHEWRQSAFLGSRRLLEHTVRANFTPDDERKKLMFHTSDECFVPLMVSFVLPKRTPFLEEMNNVLARAMQAGYMIKITRELEFDIYRSTSGRLLRVHKGLKGAPEDRELTLEDTQGMFLLLGAGFAIALFALTVEIIVWAKAIVKNRQFGESTLTERMVDKLKEHKNSIHQALLAPARKTIIYMRERRVSSAFGEYVTNRYSAAWEAMGTPTIQSPTPPLVQTEADWSPSSAPAAPDGLSADRTHHRPIRLLSF